MKRSIIVLSVVFFFFAAVTVTVGSLLSRGVSKSVTTVSSRSDSVTPVPSALTKPVTEASVETPRDNPIRVLFVGDIMMDRYIRQKTAARNYEHILASLTDFLRSFDMVVANLEGPVTNNKSTSMGTKIGEAKNYIFTFDPLSTRMLFEKNIRYLMIGNNHIMNFGREGLGETKRILREQNHTFFGDIAGEGGQDVVVDANGTKLAMVSYNAFGGNGSEKTLERIRAVKNTSDIVIVYTHWGVEYESVQPESVQSLARSFIDAGADAVIGSHPHVIAQKEVYKDKTIYYSLGNFIFDQYFDPNTKIGLGVEMSIDSRTKSIQYHEHRFDMHLDGSTKLQQPKQTGV